MVDEIPEVVEAELRAPAKLTLSLRITGVRPDRYHLIDAEMVTVDLADSLFVTPLDGLSGQGGPAGGECRDAAADDVAADDATPDEGGAGRSATGPGSGGAGSPRRAGGAPSRLDDTDADTGSAGTAAMSRGPGHPRSVVDAMSSDGGAGRGASGSDVDRAVAGDPFEVVEAGSGLPVAIGADNTVRRALVLAGRHAAVRLVKRIPAGAGLGGGSADAAAVLRWCGATDLANAAQLGADVPFCIAGGRARVQGIGEIVEPLPFEHRTFTLLIPPFGCSTPAVYAAWDRLAARGRGGVAVAGGEAPGGVGGRPGGGVGRERSVGESSSDDGPGFSGDVPASVRSPRGAGGIGPNDLEEAALLVEPRLAAWRDRLAAATGKRPVLAGSGSTWFVEGSFPGDGRIVVRTCR